MAPAGEWCFAAAPGDETGLVVNELQDQGQVKASVGDCWLCEVVHKHREYRDVPGQPWGRLRNYVRHYMYPTVRQKLQSAAPSLGGVNVPIARPGGHRNAPKARHAVPQSGATRTPDPRRIRHN